MILVCTAQTASSHGGQCWLKPLTLPVHWQAGGLWVHLGPLLYHWADSHMYLSDDELSIEVSLEDVERIAAELGFTTERREMVTAAYAANMK